MARPGTSPLHSHPPTSHSLSHTLGWSILVQETRDIHVTRIGTMSGFELAVCTILTQSIGKTLAIGDSKVYAIIFNDEIIIFNYVIQLQLYDDEIMFRIFTCAQTASHNMVSRVPHSELSPSEWEQKSLDKAIG